MKPTQNETVFLLVEDDPNDIFFVEREFRRAPGHIRLRAVPDGEEAIQYLKGTGKYGDRDCYPIPNVILLDLKMPRIGGFEFLEWLRSKSPEYLRVIPTLVMSSSNLPQDIRRAYSLGANSYMVKPLEWTKFQKLVSELGVYWTECALTPPMGS